jgi:dipeptidyl aminopeptidase/acylaminoacyl peptidase
MKNMDAETVTKHHGLLDARWANSRQLLIQPDYPVRGFGREREYIGSIRMADFNGQTATLQVLNNNPLGMIRAADEQEKKRAAKQAKQAKQGKQPKQESTGTDKAVNAVKMPEKKAEGPLRIVAGRRQSPDQVLIQTTFTDRHGITDGYGAFEWNLRGGQQRRVALLPVANGQFIAGPDDRIALAAGVNAQNERVVYYRPPSERETLGGWQLAASNAGDGLMPIAWTGKGEQYYALDARDSPTRAVVVWNAADNTRELLYRHPDIDMESAALDPTGRPWMFSGNGSYPLYWYPDADHPLARLHRTMVERLPHEQVEVMNATDDYAYAVIRTSSAQRPPVFLVMDVKAAQALHSMHAYPKLDLERLAPVEPIEFPARDGLAIRGYLTMPLDADRKPRTQAPLVVIAHDGPPGMGSNAPSSYGYEFERQLFASQGYAVLQVNHRGLGGRGAEFLRAGDNEWKGKVQDDIVDGVRWVIGRGMAEAGRICFFGMGYGAWSALSIAAREPELLKCAVALTGPYDAPLVASARAIKASVLLLHERQQQKFPIGQAEQMRDALRAAGNAPDWVTMGGFWNTGYFTPETRSDGYRTIFRFLEANLGR